MNTFGLDIGTNSIKLVKLALAGEKYKLQSYGIAPTPAKALYSESESDLILLAETIKKLVKDSKIPEREVNCALPEAKVVTTVLEIPPLSEGELAEAIKWEAEQYIPQPLSEVRLSFDIIEKPKNDKTAGKMKVLLVAAPLRLISRYQKILTLTDLKPVSLETETLAVLRALETDLGNEPSILINLGASSTQLAIIEKGNINVIRSISTGGTALARAVSSELDLEISQAEEYKKSYGLDETKLQGKVTRAIKPVLDSIIEEIKKAISFYKEKKPEQFINRAVITGGTARLPGLVSYLASELSTEVLVGNPWSDIILDPQVAKEIGDDGYLYACAVGLAMKNL